MSSHKARSFGLVVACTIAAVTLYILSLGPVLWWLQRNWTAQRDDTVRAVYAPLEWTVNHSKSARSVFWWYAGLWVRH